jgi:DNA (cytosine-5)-methyltransferase 1
MALSFGHNAAGWEWVDPTASELEPDDDHYVEPIRLTVTEALLLQGFPADYPFQGSRTKQFEQVGNAVPPALAAAVVSALTSAEGQQ